MLLALILIAQEHRTETVQTLVLEITDKKAPIELAEQVAVKGDEFEAELEAAAEAEAAAQQYVHHYNYHDSDYDDMSAQDYIAQRESGQNYDARNGRYVGKYQLDESMLCGDYSPENQEYMAEQYMLERYGSWENARDFWDEHGWW